jgi:aspartate aminotransferase
MSISRIASTIHASPTLALNAKASVLRDQGIPVIHLGGGEPKSKAPADAIQAGAALINTGEVRYTAADGTPALKKAIVRYTEEHYRRAVAAANVMASAGAKQAIMVALQTALDPGDEVIFPAPYWVSYPDMVSLCGAVGVPVLPKEGFNPRIEDIETRVGARTKVIIINSPNNPSGAMYSEEFISDIVQFCEKRDIYLIMDDIYHRLVFDGKKAPSPFDYMKKPLDESKLIAVNGVSKQYAMTGFRIGWAVGNRNLIEVMGNIQGHQTSGPSAVGQTAAVAAVNGDQSSVESLRATLESNRNVMVSALKTLQKVKFAVPDGTFYCFADFSAYDKSSTKLSEHLIDKVQVLTVPGVEFGVDGYLRLSYCGAASDITEGIKRIKWALDPDSPRELQIGTRKLVKD